MVLIALVEFKFVIFIKHKSIMVTKEISTDLFITLLMDIEGILERPCESGMNSYILNGERIIININQPRISEAVCKMYLIKLKRYDLWERALKNLME